MRTGKVVAEPGVNVQTLRYHERRGLLSAPARRESGHRVDGADAARALAVEKIAKLERMRDSLSLLAATCANRARNASASCYGRWSRSMAADSRERRLIGPVGTGARAVTGIVALTAALAMGMTGWDVGAAAVAYPVIALAVRWPTGARSGVVLAIAVASTFVTPADGPAVWAWLGGSLLLAAARGDGACEALAVPNAVEGRRRRTGCIVFTPLDAAEARGTWRRPTR